MVDPLPAFVELAIYLYFFGVAALGLALHSRLWLAPRVRGRLHSGGFVAAVADRRRESSHPPRRNRRP
ncbi:hypothetical protein C491_17724 [Natronococcus amylolyticus DSM 10524]|uniref:Uncharacterized protein n=1 Tax=Natronococcus amylolyticus DSM 10524 TaxID=1227497 RepID=L9WZS3_9EURY|nr:hypothetical protein [Natronococcus amylolyticus]ELY54960.1 hypothetical protein C491_17724 [Natronococcus amylolyticus DSM 10524]